MVIETIRNHFEDFGERLENNQWETPGFNSFLTNNQIELEQVGRGHGQEGVANDVRVGDAQDFSSFGGHSEDLEIDLSSQSYTSRSWRDGPFPGTIRFYGGGHVDSVVGSSDGETFIGDEHDNTFSPGDGIDFVYGSGRFDDDLGAYPYESTDTVSYEDSYAPTIYDGDFTGIESVASKAHHHTWGGTAHADHLFSVENFVGSDHGDVFINDYNGEDNAYTGGNGPDVYALNSRDNGGNDVWTDFTIGEDKIDVTNLKFNNQLAASLTPHDDLRQALESQGLIFSEAEIQAIIDEADANYAANGNKLILDFGELGTLELIGIGPGQISLDDFVFTETIFYNVIELDPGSNGDITLTDSPDIIEIPGGNPVPYDDGPFRDGSAAAYVTGTIRFFDPANDKIDISALGITRAEMEERFENSWNGYGGGIHGEITSFGDRTIIWINNDFSLTIWYHDKTHSGYNGEISLDNFIFAEDPADEEEPADQSGQPSHHW